MNPDLTQGGLIYGPFISRAQAKAQGLRHFFTGKPCKHGHASVRLTSNRRCCACHTIRERTIRQAMTPEEKLHWLRTCHYRPAERRKAADRRYEQKRYENSPSFRTAKCLRARLYAVVAKGQNRKATAELVGCSFEELTQHLSSLFTEGMSWANFGQWHIDHVKPIASFENPADPDCWHFTNLQPLWAEDNLRKSDTWEPVAA